MVGTSEALLPLECYLRHFGEMVRQRYKHYKMKRYDMDDLEQEARLTIIRAYPRAQLRAIEGELSCPNAYFGALVWGALKNYFIRHGFMVSAKNSTVYQKYKGLFHRCFMFGSISNDTSEAVAGSGLAFSDRTGEINLRIDIETFCNSHDRHGILQRRIEGYSIKEIAAEIGMDYKRVSKMHVLLKRRLWEFLEQEA